MDSLNSVLGWGSPIGIGVFVVFIAATLFLLSATISNLSRVDREQNRKK